MKKYIAEMAMGIAVLLLGLSMANAANFVTLDPTFQFLTSDFKDGTLVSIDCVATTPDGKVIVVAAGTHNKISEYKGSWVIRLNKDATLDTSFKNAFTVVAQCKGIAVSGDGQIAVANSDGGVVLVSNTSTTKFIPNPTNFPGSTSNSSLSDFGFANDGSLIEAFTTQTGQYAARYVQGVQDTTYNNNTGLVALLGAQLIQLDAKDNMYGASGMGPLTFTNGTPPNWQVVISKFLANGTPDASFFSDSNNLLVIHTDYTSGSGEKPPTYALRDFVLQPDGKYFLAGIMDSCFAFSRVTVDGKLDYSGTQEVCAKFAFPADSHFSIRQLSTGTLIVFHYAASDTSMVLLFGADGRMRNSYSTPTVPTGYLAPMIYKDASPGSYLALFKTADNVLGLKRYLVDTSASAFACPAGSENLIVNSGSAQYTQSFAAKCVHTTEPGDNYSCPTGQALLSAQICTTTPNTTTPNLCPSGQFVQSVYKCVVLNPEQDNQCKSSTSNLIAAGGTCIGVASISTYPDASGNCAKDQVLYSLNGVKLCGSLTAMVSDATKGAETGTGTGTDTNQLAQPSIGGGSCSLIR